MVLFGNGICHKVVVIYQTICSQTRPPVMMYFMGETKTEDKIVI